VKEAAMAFQVGDRVIAESESTARRPRAGTVREVVASQKTDAMLLPVGSGETSLELIAPKGNDGLEKFLGKRGPGLHHVAVEVEGIEDALAFLKSLGVRLIDETPRVGARGHKVAFVHPSVTGGVLVELVEPDHP
jgi:methylmalonyl-CoA/ethylmalonyl-CoA epimerase